MLRNMGLILIALAIVWLGLSIIQTLFSSPLLLVLLAVATLVVMSIFGHDKTDEDEPR